MGVRVGGTAVVGCQVDLRQGVGVEADSRGAGVVLEPSPTPIPPPELDGCTVHPKHPRTAQPPTKTRTAHLKDVHPVDVPQPPPVPPIRPIVPPPTQNLYRPPEQDVHAVDVPRVEADGVPPLRARVPEGQELVGHLGGAGQLAGPGEPQQQEVQDEAVVLCLGGGGRLRGDSVGWERVRRGRFEG